MFRYDVIDTGRPKAEAKSAQESFVGIPKETLERT
jgi:hypothetical protein